MQIKLYGNGHSCNIPVQEMSASGWVQCDAQAVGTH